MLCVYTRYILYITHQQYTFNNSNINTDLLFLYTERAKFETWRTRKGERVGKNKEFWKHCGAQIRNCDWRQRSKYVYWYCAETNDVFKYVGCFCTNVHVFLHVKGAEHAVGVLHPTWLRSQLYRSDYTCIQTRIKEHPIFDSHNQKNIALAEQHKPGLHNHTSGH